MAEKCEKKKSANCNKAKEEKCPDCQKAVHDKDKGLQCEVCEGWFRTKCQNISDEVYKHLEQNEAIHWFCLACNRAVAKIFTSLAPMRARQDKMDSQLQKLSSDFQELVEKLKGIDNSAKAAEASVKALDTKLDAVVETGFIDKLQEKVEIRVNDLMKIVKKDVSETMEQERRKNNLVIHGVK